MEMPGKERRPATGGGDNRLARTRNYISPAKLRSSCDWSSLAVPTMSKCTTYCLKAIGRTLWRTISNIPKGKTVRISGVNTATARPRCPRKQESIHVQSGPLQRGLWSWLGASLVSSGLSGGSISRMLVTVQQRFANRLQSFVEAGDACC